MAKKHGHHGGAWKVAYADFVTAMMALFLVLWLTAQDTKIKQAVERAFTHPFATVTKESTGIIQNKDTQAVKSSQGNFDSASVMELNMLRKISEELMQTLGASNPEDNQPEPLKMEITSEGLRISVFDRTRKSIFQPDTAKFTEYGKWVFTTLAWQLAKYSTNGFQLELEGHTEYGFKPKSEDFTKWELTASRANAARRLIVDHGVLDQQVHQVAGFGDVAPLPDRPPTDESNRRVTVMVRPKDKKARQTE